MRKHLLYCIALLSLININEGLAQITINTTPTGATLINSLIDPTTVTVSNVVESCPTGARGSFTAAGAEGAKLGITSGIVLTNGSAANIASVSSTLSSSSICTNPLFGSPTCAADADLKKLDASGNAQNDVCKIEFDMSTPGDSIAIAYVFGSEEYYNFAPPNSTVNDVFGFFISGPGITPPAGFTMQNFALLPNGKPVSIGNINPNSALYNQATGYLIDNLGTKNGLAVKITYDAFSKVLTAKIAVQPNKVYHIKIGVEDANDHLYDTGVFIKANSFKALALPIKLEYFTATPDRVARKNKLTWKTAQEENNNYFEVMKRVDDNPFQTIATIKGNGTTSMEHSYEYTDEQLGDGGTNYYVLRQIDFNGKNSLSSIVSVKNVANNINVHNIFPNPVTDKFTATIEMPSDVSDAKIEILDLAGRVVFVQSITLQAGTNDIVIDTETLQPGSYFFRVTDGINTCGLHRIVK